MLDILVFSKNRACQLDLLLRTLVKKIKISYNLNIVYFAENEQWKKGYELCKKYHPNFNFIEEIGRFKNIIDKTLNEMKSNYTLFLTDDDVAINELNNKEYNNLMEIFINNPQIHCLSLRMHEKINYCYPAKKSMEIPSFFRKDKYLIWSWADTKDKHTCWGYPMSVTSHIFESSKIKHLINKLNYSNPNSLESVLNSNRFKDKPLILSSKIPKFFNVQNNFVKIGYVGEQEYSVKQLNNAFLNGKRIDDLLFYKLSKNQAHGPIPYNFL